LRAGATATTPTAATTAAVPVSANVVGVYALPASSNVSCDIIHYYYVLKLVLVHRLQYMSLFAETLLAALRFNFIFLFIVAKSGGVC
jgi:hypothetical protein